MIACGRQRLPWTALCGLAFCCCGPAILRGQEASEPWYASLAPSRWGESAQGLFQQRKDPDVARQLFSQADGQFQTAAGTEGSGRREAFRQAAKLYAKAARLSPGTPLAEDALLMSAESQFFADDYVQAGEAFDQLVKDFPTSRHMDRVDQRRFAIAQYWLALTKSKQRTRWLPAPGSGNQRPALDSFGNATRMLDKIRFDNPTGKLADDATMSAGVAHFERARYNDASLLFTDIRENFPDSEHQLQAHLLDLKCQEKIYAGPDYDGGPLEKGELIIQSLLRMFPDRAAEHRDYLEQAYKEIRLKRAAREFALAEYYDRRKEYGAARTYYQRVRDQFSDTNLALESENRLAAIGGYPSEPEQPMAWLAGLFPEEQPAKPLLGGDSPKPLRR